MPIETNPVNNPVVVNQPINSSQPINQPVLVKPLTNKFTRRHFWYWSLAVIAAAVAATAVLVDVLKPEDVGINVTTVKPQTQKVEISQISQIASSNLPEKFPKDVPLETGAQLTMNYNATNADGKFQATREFISKKTVAQNFVLYQQALKENGWEITNVQENALAGSLIFAQKGNNNLNIRIYTDSEKQVRVSINNIVAN